MSGVTADRSRREPSSVTTTGRSAPGGTDAGEPHRAPPRCSRAMRAPIRSSSGPGASSASCRVAASSTSAYAACEPGRCQLGRREQHLTGDRHGAARPCRAPARPRRLGPCRAGSGRPAIPRRSRRGRPRRRRRRRPVSSKTSSAPGRVVAPRTANRREADPSCGSCSGCVALVATGGPRHQVGPAGQGGVQQLDVARGRRPSAGRRPRPHRALPVSGLSTSHATTSSAPARPGCRPAQVEPGGVEQPGSARGAPRSRVAVVTRGTERLEQPGATVGAGAAADRRRRCDGRPRRGQRRSARRCPGCVAVERRQPGRRAAGRARRPRPARPPPRCRGAPRPRHTAYRSGRWRVSGTRVNPAAPRRRGCRRPRRRRARRRSRRRGGPTAGRPRGDPRPRGGERALELVGGEQDAGHRRHLSPGWRTARSGRPAPSSASSSNSVTPAIDSPIETLVTRSRMTSTTTGTRYSAPWPWPSPAQGGSPRGRRRESPCSPSPSTTLTWSTP